jgi:hypothetical protein
VITLGEKGCCHLFNGEIDGENKAEMTAETSATVAALLQTSLSESSRVVRAVSVERDSCVLLL